MYAQLSINHRLCVMAHAASPYRVKDGRADAGGSFVQLLLGVQILAGEVFLRAESLQGRAGHNAPGQANGVSGDL